MKQQHFSPHSKMADMVAANYTLILVMPRLGIPLGFGEKCVQEVCDQCALPVDFVLMICNVYTFDDYLPDISGWQSEDVRRIIAYLQASHQYYINERLPHIERHLSHLAASAGGRYGAILKQFFADYNREVRDHFDCEERELFPLLQQSEALHRPLPRHFADNHSDLVDKMKDLTQIVYKYIPGENHAEELSELIFAIMQLSSDLEKHALIEERILLPYIARQERRLP